ncbi:MAG: hypothetical protein M3O76_04165 [Actinomycetota bacterium]|jgi:hypothetical protein|nr:hypothetical protein [Actinomycetota bacterium]
MRAGHHAARHEPPRITSNQQFSQLLKPGQWQRLVQRLGQIQNPTVPTAPSKGK